MTPEQFRCMTRPEVEAMRLKAAADLQRGIRPSIVARKYGVSRTSISRWNRTLKAGGNDALRRSNGQGRPCKLNAEKLAEVARIQATPFARLTGKGLAEVIERAWGVHYSEAHMYRLMQRLRGSA